MDSSNIKVIFFHVKQLTHKLRHVKLEINGHYFGHYPLSFVQNKKNINYKISINGKHYEAFQLGNYRHPYETQVTVCIFPLLPFFS